LKKKLLFLVSCVLLISLVAGIFTGCSSSPAKTSTTALSSTSTSTVTVASTISSPALTAVVVPADSGNVVLTVVNGSKTASYTMSQLQTLTETSGWGAQYTMHGNAGPDQYKGFKVTDLLKAVGGMTSDQSVKFTASDDYTRTLNYGQVVGGIFDLQDGSGNAVTAISTPVLAVLYEKNGAALDSNSSPLLLGILCDKTQYSGGSTWIKKIARIEVVAAQ